MKKLKKPKIQETLHKSRPGLMFMGFWQMGMVGNIYGMDSPRVSQDLVAQNLKNINFRLPITLMLDACLMVHGSWIKAHGSWPREARGGSWLMARGRPALGTQRRASGPGPAPRASAGAASGHEP